jgi:hypothetical protein
MKAETSTAEDSDSGSSPVEAAPESVPPSRTDSENGDRTSAESDGGSHETDDGDEAETATAASSSRDGSRTVQASTSSIKSVGAKEPTKPVKVERKKPEGSMVGKINNLVTTDLGTAFSFTTKK